MAKRTGHDPGARGSGSIREVCLLGSRGEREAGEAVAWAGRQYEVVDEQVVADGRVRRYIHLRAEMPAGSRRSGPVASGLAR